MALRVLLADESTTIKRVMQLALQDFAVEVKAVPVGVDVLPVSKAFHPDIIFVDVLLPKKAGYEVGQELKKDPETKNIPLVLMWSGFMELDETKAKQSMADRRLEKPFEPEALRALVQDLVKKTRDNPVSSFLNFPLLPEIKETPPKAQTQVKEDSAGAVDISNYTASRIFSIDASQDNVVAGVPQELPNFELPEEAEDFSQVPLHATPISTPKTSGTPAPTAENAGNEEWAHQDLSKFKINVPKEDEPEALAQKYMIPQEELQNPEISSHGEFDEITFTKPVTPPPAPDKSALPPRPPPAPPLSRLPDVQGLNQEEIFREEARRIIENMVWKILPEITERIVREEINKLLQDSEKPISVP